MGRPYFSVRRGMKILEVTICSDPICNQTGCGVSLKTLVIRLIHPMMIFSFMPVGDGKSGYYSKFKETGGFGKEDIYKVTFKEK